MTRPAQAAGSGHAKIQVRLRELAQLFNSLDPSPFYERDLDEDAEAFIVGSARELGTHRTFELVVHLQTLPPRDRADAVEASIHHFFRDRAAVKRRELKLLLRRGRASLIIGMVFLAACLTLGEVIGKAGFGTVASLIRESLVIGGWVAMWRPLEIFLYDWWPVRDELNILDRLGHAKVKLVLPEPQPRMS